MAVFILLLCACATTQTIPSSSAGLCDPAIDETVRGGDWEKALQDHERLLRNVPGDCLAMYHLGYIWGQLGDRPKEFQFYKQAIQCGYNSDDRLYFNMGMALASMGDLKEAQKIFEKAISINPSDADNYFGLGIIYQAQEQFDQAEIAWLKTVALDKRHIEAHLALAHLFLDQGRWDETRSHLQRVLSEEPDNEEAIELMKILKSRQALEY